MISKDSHTRISISRCLNHAALKIKQQDKNYILREKDGNKLPQLVKINKDNNVRKTIGTRNLKSNNIENFSIPDTRITPLVLNRNAENNNRHRKVTFANANIKSTAIYRLIIQTRGRKHLLPSKSCNNKRIYRKSLFNRVADNEIIDLE